MPSQRLSRYVLVPALAAVAACGGDKGVAPVACSPGTAATLDLAPHEAATLTSAESCVGLQGNGARYLVVPQLASTASSPATYSYVLGPPGEAAASVHEVFSHASPLQQQFDLALRRAEAQLPRPANVYFKQQVDANVTAASLPATRTFKVLSTLDTRNPTYATVTADLRYLGGSIALYQDRDARAFPLGFDDTKLEALGRLFDQDLFPLGISHFGGVSDIDDNGRVIVLLTPVVNSLSDRATCATQGFVSGFFFGFDLSGTTSNSNRAEIYYSAVPDPTGEFSCALSAALIERVAPPTFIHELQHMISYNHHVLQRRASAEVLWLNEGLSHIAEEMGSRYYEERYPPPSGRTDPTQLFPDSSQGFIAGNVTNAYRYLRAPAVTSVTSTTGFGGLSERGASWLFLRWLADQKGENIFRALVQTSRTGIENVQAVAGEPFDVLFGDFSLAIWGDSIPGLPRATVPARYRFSTRNLRQIFQALYDSRNAGSPDPMVPTPFPVVPRTLNPELAWNDAMVRGTMDYFLLDTPLGGDDAVLRFASPSGTPLAPDLRGQVGFLRVH